MNIAKCSSCGAPIEWTVTEKGRPMPVDAVPTENGNLTISMRGGPGTAIYLSEADKAKLRGEAAYRGEVAKFWISHFATCPTAAQHRQKA